MPRALPYDPSVETIAPDEGETIEGLRDAFREILDTTSANYGRAVRSVHAKGHGLLRARLTVAACLPPELAQGLFAAPGTHEAIMRLSTSPGDILDDSVSAPRGIAIKILGVDGPRVAGSEGDRTQDFLMANGPVFGAAKPDQFLKNLKLLARTTDRAEGAKKLLSATLRGVESVLETVGIESSLVKQLGGAPEVHPMGETYYSQTAFRYGDHIAKFALAPIDPALTAVTGQIVATRGRPDALREEVDAVTQRAGGRWELRVQLQTDRETMPVEDPTVEWDEAESPFRMVAILEAHPQTGWQGTRSEAAEDRLSFSVWHALEAHRPLGAINRARRGAYPFSAGYRADFNRCPVNEPASLAELEPAD